MGDYNDNIAGNNSDNVINGDVNSSDNTDEFE